MCRHDLFQKHVFKVIFVYSIATYKKSDCHYNKKN